MIRLGAPGGLHHVVGQVDVHRRVAGIGEQDARREVLVPTEKVATVGEIIWWSWLSWGTAPVTGWFIAAVWLLNRSATPARSFSGRSGQKG